MSDRTKDILRIVGTVLFFVAIAFALRSDSLRHHLASLDQLRADLHDADVRFGPIGSRLLMLIVASLLIGIGLPRLWLSTAFGALFGPVVGTILSMAATLGGTCITYQAGKSILHGIVKRRFGARVQQWKQRFRENTFAWVLYGRLIPVSNATVMNLVCGACKVRFGPYLAASFLGYLPLTITFALFGKGSTGGGPLQIAIAAFLLVGMFALQAVMKKPRPTADGSDRNRTSGAGARS